MRRATFVLAAGSFAVAAVSRAQNAALSSEIRGRVDSAVTKFMGANSVPGLSATIVVHGVIRWSQGFGMADLEHRVPATPATLYRLASLSKPITATAALMLSERGKLDLDAPVQHYCPTFPPKPWPITTRELLGHLGGIRHYRSETPLDPENGNTRHFTDPMAAGLAFFANDTLVAPPRTRYHYTTHGYTLIGCAIEGASAQHYTDFVRANVLGPAGMAHTLVDDHFAIIPDRTRFYHHDSTGQVVNAAFLDAGYKVPGGGWLSSADDMARFAIALFNGTLLRRPARDAMWTGQRTAAGAWTGYGLGWSVDTTAGVTHISHNGGQQGTSTSIVLTPSQNTGVVVLTNIDGVNAFALATDLLRLVSDGH
jgi:serine beta-lactamase-like protein LACTB, mitochondrial